MNSVQEYWNGLARNAYNAYGKSTAGKNFRGEPMPDYNDLPEPIRQAWLAAVYQVSYDLSNDYEDL